MSRKLAIWSVVVLALAVLLPAAPVAAKDALPDDGTTILNEDYTLSSEDRVRGDLVVINGDATLESGSRVEGSVFVWSGSADVEGTVEGDLTVTQGDIYLGEDATVDGNVVCGWNCDLDRAEGAHIGGDVVSGVPFPLPEIVAPDAPRLQPEEPTIIQGFGARPLVNWVFRVIRAFAAMVVLAIVAGMVTAILPNHTAEVGRTVVSAPVQSAAIGILTTIAATVLIVVLAVTICFSPVAILLALAVGTASLFGWIGIGALVGQRLLRSAGSQNGSPLWAAALGTLLISMLTVFVGAVGVACLDVIASAVSVVVGFVGLGAVVLSRFGTAVYDPAERTRSAVESSDEDVVVSGDLLETGEAEEPSGQPPDEGADEAAFASE